MSRNRIELCSAFLALVCLVLGCASEAPTKGTVKKAPVSGTVTMGGQPLEGADVYFYTDKFTGFGKTDAQGKFRLAQGAAIGSNKVFISKLEGGSSATPVASDPVLALNDPGQVEAAAQSGNLTNQPKELVPPEFSDQMRTKLKFDVVEGGAKDADFNL